MHPPAPLLAAVAWATLAAAAPSLGAAAPSADVVVVWAPGARVAPIEEAARRAGAAVIDRSPAANAVPATASVLKRGIDAYDALRLDEAWVTLDEARALADRTGGAGLSQAQLADLFLYRGLVKIQQGELSAYWDELVTSVTLDPVRVLDPARFPPRVASELARVHEALTDRKRATLAVDAPAGCTVLIDGAAASAVGSAQPLVGSHWVSVTCADRAPWGTRVELTGDQLVVARNTALAPPTDDEVLIQARTVGARAFVAVEIRSGVGTARLVGVDGRERDRRSVAITGDLTQLAAAVSSLLAPVGTSHWYESRWAWAAGAAVVAAAILIPITAAAAQNNSPSTWTVRPVYTWP
ncbi:MAG TPA: hypothetical protein VK601_08400 [Kofleriaceae bacterium]|nr:hypothetical protein [Kofleriaceae bacterium]